MMYFDPRLGRLIAETATQAAKRGRGRPKKEPALLHGSTQKPVSAADVLHANKDRSAPSSVVFTRQGDPRTWEPVLDWAKKHGYTADNLPLPVAQMIAIFALDPKTAYTNSVKTLRSMMFTTWYTGRVMLALIEHGPISQILSKFHGFGAEKLQFAIHFFGLGAEYILGLETTPVLYVRFPRPTKVTFQKINLLISAKATDVTFEPQGALVPTNAVFRLQWS